MAPDEACALLQQTSRTRCVHGVTYGCADDTSLWLKRCRGTFRCGNHTIQCGDYKVAEATCVCSGERAAQRAFRAHLSVMPGFEPQLSKSHPLNPTTGTLGSLSDSLTQLHVATGAPRP